MLIRFLNCELTPHHYDLLFRVLPSILQLESISKEREHNGIMVTATAILSTTNEIILGYAIPKAGPTKGKPDLLTYLTRAQYDDLLNTLSQHQQLHQLLIALNLQSKEETNEYEANINGIRFGPCVRNENSRIFFHSHLDFPTYDYIIEAITNSSIQSFYLELPCAILLPTFQLFNDNGDSDFLQQQLNYTVLEFPELNPKFIQICRACYRNNIRILPVDKIYCNDSVPDMTYNEYILERNSFITNNIRMLQNTNDTAFAGLFGALHYSIAKGLQTYSEFVYSSKCRDLEDMLSLKCHFDTLQHIKTSNQSLCGLVGKIGLFATPILAYTAYQIINNNYTL